MGRVRSKLFHVGVPGTVKSIGMRTAQSRAQQLQQLHFRNDFDLTVYGKLRKPSIEFIGGRYLPHWSIIAQRLCHVNSFKAICIIPLGLVPVNSTSLTGISPQPSAVGATSGAAMPSPPAFGNRKNTEHSSSDATAAKKHHTDRNVFQYRK